MPKIKLEYVDKLTLIKTELNAIAYMQGLLEYDKNSNIFFGEEYEKMRDAADVYLEQRQLETVFKLNEIFDKDDFLEPIKKSGTNA